MATIERRRQTIVPGTRRSSVHSSIINNVATKSTTALNDIKVGARVLVNGEHCGTVCYSGTTSFQVGKWIGVELDEPVGKNSGVVQGKRYFECRTNHGVFVRPTSVTLLADKKNRLQEDDDVPGSPRSDGSRNSAGNPKQDPGSTKAAARRSATQPLPQPQLQRRKSLAPSAIETRPTIQRRKSVAPSAIETQPTAQRRKSIAPSATETQSPAQRRKSLAPSAVEPVTPSRTSRVQQTAQTTSSPRRPTSLVQTNTRTTPTTPTNARVTRANTVNGNASPARRKSLSVSASPVQTGRPRSNTQGSAAQQDAKDARERQLQQIRLHQKKVLEAQKQAEEAASREQREQSSSIDQTTSSEDDISEEDVLATPREQNSPNAQITHVSQSPEPMEWNVHTDEKQQRDVDAHSYHPQIQRQMQQQQQHQSPSYGSLAETMPVSKSEQMIPLKDYEELRFKLKVLEAKRQEDRERYKEHEKIKEEAEQFLTLRNKLQDKIAELQKDLRDTKRELKETAADKETLELKFSEITDSLEMMTLDKEVAEERADALQQEVNMLRDKMEEISVDLDILRKEAIVLNTPPEQRSQESAALEIVQLERHNERLRDALIRLRDAATETELELNMTIKELEQENLELSEIKVQYEKVKEKLQTAEAQIEDLRSRLDDAMGAEELVEQLTEKNLALMEKMEEMNASVDDLEALKELADELEENHVETEKQLQAEIDHRDMLLREQIVRLKTLEETNLDYEATIQQFRELVQHLQSDLDHLRQKEEDRQSENVNLSSQSQAMMSLNMQLQSTVMKAQAKAIDLELRKLEAAQANDRLSYIQPYLPDAFFKTENDPISCLLLFKRLVFKSDLIIKHLDQNYPISEKIMENVSEHLVAVCEMRQKACWLGDLSKRFVTFMKQCTPTIFAKMAQVYHDLIGTERRLNAIVELFRTDEANESECILDLQRIIAHLEHLAEVYFTEDSDVGNADLFFGLTRALDMNADKMMVEMTFVRQTLENAARKEGMVLVEGIDRLDYDYLEPLGRLITETKNSKIFVRKILRQLDDLSEQALTPKAEHLHRFKTMYALSSKLGQFCYEILKQILSYVESKRGSKENLSIAQIQEIIYRKSDDILDIPEVSMFDGCSKILKSLTSELSVTLKRVESDTRMDKISTGVQPWIQRASDMKAEVVINHDLARKLQQHGEEIIKLVRDIKLKDLALQEANVKVDLLERRMETAKKDAEQITTLQESLEKAKAQTQMYSEAMENLQAEYETLEQENIQLKQAHAKQNDKRVSLSNKMPNFEGSHEESVSLSEKMSDVYQDNHNQMEALKMAIRYLRAENAQLKSNDFARSLHLDGLPPVVKYVAAPENTDDDIDEVEEKDKADVEAENKTVDSRTMLRSIATEARVLVKDMRSVTASPWVVALSADQAPSGKWQSMKKAPDYQYQAQQSVLYTLKQRSDALRRKIQTLQQTPTTGEEDITRPLSLSAIQRPLQQLSQSIAKVQIPFSAATSTAVTSQKRCIHLKSAAEFERIHSIFIR